MLVVVLHVLGAERAEAADDCWARRFDAYWAEWKKDGCWREVTASWELGVQRQRTLPPRKHQGQSSGQKEPETYTLDENH
jgi:hypothetical protein